jgi:WD40 repeat protein
MRLLQCDGEDELRFTKDFKKDDKVPPYAILSHTWQHEEVTFSEIITGSYKSKHGYRKIRFCAQQAKRDGLEYFWVDTCCINKENTFELRDAINSMFHWYQNAAKCYAYLSDVAIRKRRLCTAPNEEVWEPAFRASRWFTRGWTLQELLAPRVVQFYSTEWEPLGDRKSLQQHIHEITRIPNSALEGARLSQFSVNERLSWNEHRHTELEEDKAYSLLGIFDVYIPPIYGEGIGGAYRRLMHEIKKLSRCIQDLHLTDPSDDKKRIEDTKGGLLKDSYRWILDNADFQKWRDDEQSRLLWIKGDAGKGKTMLLCGILNELKISTRVNNIPLSFFFCQASDSRINSATSVLRGLLYVLVKQQPRLVSHIRERHDYTGKDLFENANAWVALTEIFSNVLQDPSLSSTYLLIDALDECMVDLPKLLRFIAQQTRLSSAKWIVSSRNWPDIEEQLERADHRVRLSLELNARSVSMAVNIFIEQRVSQLAQDKLYDGRTQDAVLAHLRSHANNTFLWVAIVCQSLERVAQRNVMTALDAFPPGLNSLYERMMGQIRSSDDSTRCKQILASVAVVYRPITLRELAVLIEGLQDIADDLGSIREVIGFCYSFLTIQDETVYFVHQSARDFLFTKVFDEIFPSGSADIHHTIFLRSLQILSKTLRRDMYTLNAPGYSIEQIDLLELDPDPLAASRYSCVYWIDHLLAYSLDPSTTHCVDLQNEGVVQMFLEKKYLHWLEALSLCKSMSKGVASIGRLEALVQVNKISTIHSYRYTNDNKIGAYTSPLIDLVRDARRFIMSYKWTIEKSPLQTYVSALVFSPTRSLIRGFSTTEEPEWVKITPSMQEKWSACLQTLEGHRDPVWSAVFSHDSARLASASWDRTVKVWDARSGECLLTLEGHSDAVWSVAFSHNSTRLASASKDSTVKIWDASSAECLVALEGHSGSVNSVAFSYDSRQLASASDDCTVKVWDVSSGECLATLLGHCRPVNSVAFSHDSSRLVSASSDHTVKIWDVGSSNCLQTLEGHSSDVTSVAFSYNSARLASGSYDRTVKVWDATSGRCLATLDGYRDAVSSVAFSYDLTQLASASKDGTVKVWDASSGECLSTFKGHSDVVRAVSFSHDSAWLVSASDDRTVKVWDASSDECLLSLNGHSDAVKLVAFSHDSAQLASASWDRTVKTWDARSGKCLQTLEGHSRSVNSVAFSHDSAYLASASDDRTIKVWDTNIGECLQTLEGHSGSIWSVAFSHNSTKLASGSSDRMVKVWDTRSGECLQTLQAHRSDVTSLAFSHDSSRLASTSSDRTVKVWDTISGKALSTLSTLEIGSNVFFKISFNATGSCLQTDLGIIYISALSSSRPLLTYEEQPRNPRCQGIALSADGVWITHNSEKILWLPSEYRPTCSAVSGNMISVGAGSGRVWICKISMLTC